MMRRCALGGMAALAITLLLAGCTPMVAAPEGGSPPDGVQLDARRAADGTVLLTLRNGSPTDIGYNLCASALRKRTGGTWQSIDTTDVCTMELRILRPGAEATFSKTLPSSLASGKYQFVTNVEMPLGAEQVGVTSGVFSIP